MFWLDLVVRGVSFGGSLLYVIRLYFLPRPSLTVI